MTRRCHSLLVALLCVALVPDLVAAARPGFQTRPHAAVVKVDPQRIRVMDGDTAEIRWSSADRETVRVLGIDTAELYPDRARRGGGISARGAEARGFARGAFATARRVELRRAAQLDRWGRTLGYFFLDGRNYSVLALEAGMARETVSKFGDNGLAREAGEVRAAARREGAALGTR